MKTDNGVVIYYHGHCYDGFGAAWTARGIFGEPTTFIPCTWGKEPPKTGTDSKNLSVIWVDFCPDPERLVEDSKKVYEILVLDHHASAQQRWEEWKSKNDVPDNLEVHFNQERSGAILMWERFYGEKPPPLILSYIQDRDLYKFELPQSRTVCSALYSYPYDFALWDGLSVRLEEDFDSIVQEGIGIERSVYQQVERMMSGKHPIIMDGKRGIAVNASCFTSEIGEVLSEEHEDVSFAAVYRRLPSGDFAIQLRSNKRGLDVSKLAATFGGGGHPNASGCFISPNDKRVNLVTK